LLIDPIPDRSEIVAQVGLAGRLDPAEHPGA
jgi:hypothetical protein